MMVDKCLAFSIIQEHEGTEIMMCEEVANDSWYDLKEGTSPTRTHDASSEKPAQNVLAHVSRSKFDIRACSIH